MDSFLDKYWLHQCTLMAWFVAQLYYSWPVHDHCGSQAFRLSHSRGHQNPFRHKANYLEAGAQSSLLSNEGL